MTQIQEINILFQKRIDQLEKKKKKCMQYSSTPNSCVDKVEAQIQRTRNIIRIANLRRRQMESQSLVDSYLELLEGGTPKSPVSKAVIYGLGALGTYKAVKTGIRRSDCKQYKYSPYLHKRCMQGLDEAEGWEGLPRGWKQSSLHKFSKKLTGKKATQKGFFDKCVKRMQGKIDNPQAFCASTKDEISGSTYWRGKGKTPQQAGKDVKTIRNVKQENFQLSPSPLENDPYLNFLYTDTRRMAKEWRGPNIPYGDDSNRPNLIRKCTMLESPQLKINCLRKLRDQVAMNPFYQYRIDRYVDEITNTYEPTAEPGTIPGNEFKSTAVGEDLKESYVQEGSPGIVKYKGETFQVDEGGHLLNPNSYSAVWVEYACKKIGINKITPQHIKVIKMVRSYFNKNKAFPMIRVIEKVNNINLKTLYDLFPSGPVESLGLIIGLPYKEVKRLTD